MHVELAEICHQMDKQHSVSSKEDNDIDPNDIFKGWSVLLTTNTKSATVIIMEMRICAMRENHHHAGDFVPYSKIKKHCQGA